MFKLFVRGGPWVKSFLAMKEGMGNEPTGPEKLMLAVLEVDWRDGRKGEGLDVQDKARPARKSRDRRPVSLYFFRVPRAPRLSAAHDASTIRTMIFASDKKAGRGSCPRATGCLSGAVGR
jgi:hypothetical protein